MKVFNRAKYVNCDKIGDHFLETRAGIIDTIHEMEVVLLTDMRTMEITRAESSIIRAPYRICREISGRAAALAAQVIDGKIGGAVRSLVGGPGGCYQLEDLCLEAVKAIKQCTYAFTEGDRIDLLRSFDAALHGTCHAHCHSLEEKIKECASPNLVVYGFYQIVFCIPAHCTATEIKVDASLCRPGHKLLRHLRRAACGGLPGLPGALCRPEAVSRQRLDVLPESSHPCSNHTAGLGADGPALDYKYNRYII